METVRYGVRYYVQSGKLEYTEYRCDHYMPQTQDGTDIDRHLGKYYWCYGLTQKQALNNLCCYMRVHAAAAENSISVYDAGIATVRAALKKGK